MATSIEPQAAQRYVDFDEYVEFQLQKARAGIKSTDILTALAGVATLVLAYLLVFVVFDHWVITGGFGQTSRILMLGLLGVLTVAWLIWKVGIPWVRQVNQLYAARAIERSDPALKNSLLNLVDLRASGKPVPAEILTAIEKRAALGISHVDMDQAIDRRPLVRASYALCVVILLFCAYTLFSPKRISNSIWRALFPTAAVAAPTQTEILEVDPGDAEILARTQLEVTVDLRGQMPEQVTLFYSTADRRLVDEPLEMREVADDLLQPAGPQPAATGPRQYRALIAGEGGRGILQDMTYRIAAGDAVTRDYKITVNQPPSARVDEVALTYPQYMELEPYTQPTGHITAWEGTVVGLRATANMPVKAARLEFLNEAEAAELVFDLPMQIRGDGTELRAKWTLTISPDGTFPRFYRIQVRNEKGESDPQPTVYSLTIRPDQPPEVTLLDPTRDLERPANGVVPLMLQAHDPDFKLSELTLRVEKNKEPLPISPRIFEGPPQPAFAATFEWDLKQHQVKPGDTLTYWIEARDNKSPDSNRRNTPKLNIQIIEPVTPEEAAQQLQEEKQRQQQKLQENNPNQDEQRPENADQPKSAGEQQGEQQKQDQPQEGAQGDQAEPMSGDEGQGQEQQQQGGKGQQGGAKQSTGQVGEGQGQEQLDPNGAEDRKAIERFLENLDKNQKPGENQSGEKPQSEKNGRQQPQQDSPEKGAQPEQSQQPRSDSPPQNREPSAANQPNAGQQNSQQKPEPGREGEQPMGNDPSQSAKGGARQNGQKGAGEPGQSPQDAADQQGTPPQTGERTGDSKQPMNAGEKQPGEQQKPSGSEPREPTADQHSTEDMTGNRSTDPMQQREGAQPGQEKTPATNEGAQGSDQKPEGTQQQGGDNKAGTEKPKQDGQGEQKPSDDPMAAQKGEPSADEQQQQTGTPKTDPNAAPQKTQDRMRTEDGSKPAGEKQAGESQPKDARPDQQQGTENPREADPSQQTKKGSQPQDQRTDEKRSEPTDKGAKTPSAKRDDQKQGANDTPKGEGAKQGQRSEQPDAGEVGSGAKSDQGQPGSNDRGPGDNVNQPGNKGESSDQTGGKKQGEQKGAGSKSEKAGDQDGPPAGGPAGEKKDDAQSPSPSQGGDSNAEKSNQSGGNQKGDQQKGQDGQPSDSAGDNPSGGFGERPGQRGADQPTGAQAGAHDEANQPEQANEEYGRQAANLVLKNLEDQIERGEIDEEWLKETGWTQDEARRFAERLRKSLNREQPATPQELARQRQFEEMLRTLRKPDVGAPRSGENVRDEPSLIETGPRRLPVPREYQELYYEYRKSQAKRTTVPKE